MSRTRHLSVRRNTVMRGLMVIAVAAVVLLTACSANGDDPVQSEPGPGQATSATDTRPGDAPITGVELTKSGACGEAFFWAADRADRIAVTVTVTETNRSARVPTTVNFTVPDEEVEVQVVTGRKLSRNFCTDVIDMQSSPLTADDAIAGHGTITLAPRAAADDPTCGTDGTLQLSGVATENGTTFASTTVTSDDIGCYAG